MNGYEIGKDMKEVFQRIERLEKIVALNEEDDSNGLQFTENNVTEEENIKIIAPDIEFVDPDGKLLSEIPSNIAYPPVNKIKVYITGGCKRWNTGFPDWRNKASYGGTIWIQHVDTGEKIKFNYIQTGSHTDCNISFDDTSRAYSEGRKTHLCGYGFRGTLGGKPAFSSWAKFRFPDGYGYNVKKFTCMC